MTTKSKLQRLKRILNSLLVEISTAVILIIVLFPLAVVLIRERGERSSELTFQKDIQISAHDFKIENHAIHDLVLMLASRNELTGKNIADRITKEGGLVNYVTDKTPDSFISLSFRLKGFRISNWFIFIHYNNTKLQMSAGAVCELTLHQKKVDLLFVQKSITKHSLVYYCEVDGNHGNAMNIEQIVTSLAKDGVELKTIGPFKAVPNLTFSRYHTRVGGQ